MTDTVFFNEDILNDMINFRKMEIKTYMGCHNHVAMIFDKKTCTPLSYGTNYFVSGANSITIHAEHDAFLRLKENKKKIKKINIIVIRYTNTYNLSKSKPCAFCIDHMNNLANSKGYSIENVYYSENNNIHMIKFKKLKDEEDKHIPKRYR
jgi:cytidine deaminase